MTESLSKEKLIEIEKEKKNAALKEEERLDKLIETYFTNGLSPKTTEDKIGLNMGISQPIEEDISSNDDKEEKSNNPKITEEDEEVFLIHDDGQITSEITESKNVKLKEGYAIARQTIVEKAIYNKAINNIYKKIEEYQKLLNKLNNNDELLALSKLLEKSSDEVLSNMRSYRSELNATGFSQYADIPIDTIDLYQIRTKELKKIVNLEIEKITINLINGGTK